MRRKVKRAFEVFPKTSYACHKIKNTTRMQYIFKIAFQHKQNTHSNKSSTKVYFVYVSFSVH